MFVIFLCSVLFFLCLLVFKKFSRDKIKGFEAPPGIPILGHALVCNTSEKLSNHLIKCSKKYKSFMIKVGPFKTVLIVQDINFIRFVLSSNSIITKSLDYNFYLPWLGTGILLSSGAYWRQHRKIITPAFHFQILEQNLATLENTSDILIKQLKKQLNQKSIEISTLISLYTLDVICETAMGTSVNAQLNVKSDYVKAVTKLTENFVKRVFSPIKMYDFLYQFTSDSREEKKWLKTVHDLTENVIRMKRVTMQNTKNNNYAKKPFIDILLEDSLQGKPLTDEEIRNEVNTLMFAGHDTTSVGITFALYLLANHPEVQENAFNEQKSIFEIDRDRETTMQDLHDMKYLEMVIKETLRLYPSVPYIGRYVENDISFGDYFVPKKETVILSLIGLHQNPDNFPEPFKFDPTRFDETKNRIPPYAYLPFSAGPRNCIGQKFAMIEMKFTLGRILRNFELYPADPNPELTLLFETVLKSKNGVTIRLGERKW